MSMHDELYGPHAALLNDCRVTIYSDSRPERHMTLQHQPTGITVQASGTSDIAIKRELLNELAGKLAVRG